MEMSVEEFVSWTQKSAETIKVYEYIDPKMDVSQHARTLPAKTGKCGGDWVITAEVQEDYHEWINDFVATHPEHGIVVGNFEDTIWATTPEGYADFLKHNPYEDWDYWDI